MNTTAQDFETLLRQTGRELNVRLRADAAAVAIYASQRAAYLSSLVGQKGFDEALIAERDSVALKAGVSAVASADAFDARVVGIIQSVLLLGANALAGSAGGGAPPTA
jgi:hypothetical protein